MVAIILGVIAWGSASGPEGRMTLGLGVLGVILNVSLLAFLICAGSLAQRAQREEREEEIKKLMRSMDRE